ncbi:MAG TPA: ABC transporter permease subunit [Archangium sp.]|uniref:ABC transporter permease subunit n=1 Tax=Archangium sp. TaxID=1872627 RepID=UPI002E379FCD|nr:ABC transporter permease subunit [Archangium sp.]HEX5746181.1 ABC transporter permease subunit [Archangium sp.]
MTRALLLGLVLVCLPTFAQEAPPAEPQGLAAVRARGELLWGADAQGGAPYVFQDPMDPNRLVGFEVDLAEALAAKLGVRARPVLGPLARDGTLRRIYERWGLWNAETAQLLGDADPSPRGVPEQYEAWRAAVGRVPPVLERVRERYPATLSLFARGAVMTLGVSLLSMALAVAAGVVLALTRVYGPLPLRWLATAYIEVVRGTPLLVQLTLVYFGLPQLGLRLEPFTAGVLTLGLNYAAAEAENYRAGLASVPAGQHEAARVLGLSRWQTLRHVVMPQAVRISLPPMTNDFIALLKDSSLVSLVTLTELTRTYLNLANAMRDHLGLGLLVAALYLLLGLPFARLARTVEARLGRHLKEVPR